MKGKTLSDLYAANRTSIPCSRYNSTLPQVPVQFVNFPEGQIWKLHVVLDSCGVDRYTLGGAIW